MVKFNIANKLSIAVVTLTIITLILSFTALIIYSNRVFNISLANEMEFQSKKTRDVLVSVENKIESTVMYIENMTRLAYEPTTILREVKQSAPFINYIIMTNEDNEISNIEPYQPNMLGQKYDLHGYSKTAKGGYLYSDGQIVSIKPSWIAIGGSQRLIGYVIVGIDPNYIYKSIEDQVGSSYVICGRNGLIYSKSHNGSNVCAYGNTKSDNAYS